jgi:hypothetical protein
MYLGSFFLEPKDIKSIRLGAFGTLLKQQASYILTWGKNGPSIKA